MNVVSLKEKYEKKIKILGGQAQKAKTYGGNVNNIEGQIRGIKWALHKLLLQIEQDRLSDKVEEQSKAQKYYDEGVKDGRGK